MPEQIQKAVLPSPLATEFLANERTFLAWVRTSIAVVSLGFAAAKFDGLLNQLSESTRAQAFGKIGWSVPIGFAMIAFGGLLTVFAAWRYTDVNRQIERGGAVSADRGLIVLVTLLVVALATIFILYLLASGGKI